MKQNQPFEVSYVAGSPAICKADQTTIDMCIFTVMF